MKFIKNRFVVQLNSLCPDKIGFVDGYTDEDNIYGFYKHNKSWKATDLASGCLVIVQPTRKGCAEWIERNQDKIRNAKNRPDYDVKVKNFTNLIKKSLEDLKKERTTNEAKE